VIGIDGDPPVPRHCLGLVQLRPITLTDKPINDNGRGSAVADSTKSRGANKPESAADELIETTLVAAAKLIGLRAGGRSASRW
jgi:hypothetical protein